MRYRYPDFYFDFECIADKCRHSCCKDWEIVVDEDTIEKYSSLPERQATEIVGQIAFKDGEYCMKLRENGCCPFLESSGLCRLILEYGEDYISDICSEHPRFYNDFENCTETGLGLCCEEVCRLLFLGNAPLEFIEIADEDEEIRPDDRENYTLGFREECLNALVNGKEKGFTGLLETLFPGKALPNIKDLCSFLKKLEILDPEWKNRLDRVAQYEAVTVLPGEDIRYIRLFQYLLYRQSPDCSGEDELKEAALFSICAVMLIFAAECCGEDFSDTVRMFSSEIEYSDENIGLIKEYLAD